MKTLKNIIDVYSWIGEAFVHQTQESSENDLKKETLFGIYEERLKEYVKAHHNFKDSEGYIEIESFFKGLFLIDKDFINCEISDDEKLTASLCWGAVGVNLDDELYIEMWVDGDGLLGNWEWESISSKEKLNIINFLEKKNLLNESFVHQTEEETETDLTKENVYDVKRPLTWNRDFRKLYDIVTSIENIDDDLEGTLKEWGCKLRYRDSGYDDGVDGDEDGDEYVMYQSIEVFDSEKKGMYFTIYYGNNSGDVGYVEG